MGKVRWDLIIKRSLKQDLSARERKQIAWIPGPIATGQVERPPAHESVYLLLIVSEDLRTGKSEKVTKIDGSGERDRPSERKLRSR